MGRWGDDTYRFMLCEVAKNLKQLADRAKDWKVWRDVKRGGIM